MKKYFWLKLKNDFFIQREIKKLRNIAGGDTYVIIYLKLQLHSLANVGKILYAETEESIVEQLSYDLDEDAQNIQVTLAFLEKHKLVEIQANQDISMIETKELIGSESESASRVRRYREKVKALHCNTTVTDSNKLVTTEQEQQIEKEKKKETDTEQQTQQNDNFINKNLFSIVTSSEEIELIKNALISLEVPFDEAKSILDKYSIEIIDKAISLTHEANKSNAIQSKPVHYLKGILKKINKEGEL
ncbi:hypothetical protein LA02_1629 [Francisella philomiragia]|uniref:phage replisome organizer N-terminal domain-containing protein n=1 Tax=Francisella philomiragia TaxID=28110 RepID=UPI0005A5675F|nr:phage replisome organizer N-terminal domain-containing protein [Francisella philomiragia]AJI57873.1 hypothetical protein LA02_1629 [Francisella philomiragia]